VSTRRALLALPSLAIACAGLRLPGDDRTDAAPPRPGLGGVEERMPAPPRKPATTYTPSGPGRPNYLASPLVSDRPARGEKQAKRPARGRGADRDGLDEFGRALVEVTGDLARAAGVQAPVPDDRHNALAHDIALMSRTERPPPSEAVRFLTSHYGIVDTDPLIFTLRGPADRPSALEHFRRALPRVFTQANGGRWNRVGVGYLQRAQELTTVVLLWEQYLELAPLPRKAPTGAGVPITGRFLNQYTKPQLVITMPGGYVRALPMGRRGDRFDAELRCSFGDGRYQIEMVAADASGPLVLANFPLFCGVDPPVDVAAHDEDDPADIDPAQAEQELFALINTDRRAAGLLALVWDNRLAAIARSHSRDMAENRFIAHVSPTTGDTETRVRKAGGRYDLVLENVGQEGGVRQAHQGFMHSPGHRANVLNQHATFIGIGAVVNNRRSGAPLIVTELFAR
jgi:uncharacterized protein YkwD